MASAEHEPITGVCGQSPQRGPGAEPLVRGQGAKPPEAESILVIGCPKEPANLAPVRENSMLCYGPLVSELGGAQRAWCPPTPSLGGLCLPPAPQPMRWRCTRCCTDQPSSRRPLERSRCSTAPTATALVGTSRHPADATDGTWSTRGSRCR